MSNWGGKFWSGLPLGRDVSLLNVDGNGLAAFNKPAGVLSHPNQKSDQPLSLLDAHYALDGEFYQWKDAGGADRKLWLLNRLDSATSGVILAAASQELADEVRAQFKRKQVRKVYHALVFGTPAKSVDVWRDLLAVEKRAGQIRTATHAGQVPAESRASVVRVGRKATKLTLIRLEPKTGRSHQLRVQCAKRHVPIVGDQTYGDFARNRAFAKEAGTKRLFLHSFETSFSYAWKQQDHTFAAKAALPPEFEAWL
jgi:23S rRNA-/tRNA-specific pseudouridylate synthase